MATTKKVFKNETKKPQLYYDHDMNPILVKPGQTYVDEIPDRIDITDLIERERDRRVLEGDVDELKRVKRVYALVRTAATVEALEKLKANEKNADVLEAILNKEKELLDAGDSRSEG